MRPLRLVLTLFAWLALAFARVKLATEERAVQDVLERLIDGYVAGRFKA